jgi:hypothetical protein
MYTGVVGSVWQGPVGEWKVNEYVIRRTLNLNRMYDVEATFN